MSAPRRRKSWELPDSALTDEQVYLSRRRFVKALGAGGLLAVGASLGGRRLLQSGWAQEPLPDMPPLAGAPNPVFADAGRAVSSPEIALRYNNFYEFSEEKDAVWKLSRNFKLDPYSLEVGGLVERPGTLALEQVEALGLEERTYRFRCVEAWAMTVPWIGLPLAKLLEHVGVKAEAKYVAFESFLDPEQAPGQRPAPFRSYTWPYYEALTIEEAMNPLTLLASGIYGGRLPPQSGAPLRLVVPWKYGYKSAKSVVKLRLLAQRPPTFWNDAFAEEYSWLSNVEPEVPHPRWSQASERLIGSDERVETQLYNGYGEHVAHLYPS